MSQTDTLRAFDATLMDAFHAAGWADTATYTPLVGAPVACKVYVDRAAAFLDQDGVAVAGHRIVIGILRADVDRPEAGGMVAVGSETFELEELLQRDESITRWVVLP